jgi:hypothetical protein
VSTQLELLEILPRAQMAELLAEELAGRGFQRRNQALVRREKGVTVTIDPDTGTVTVQAVADEQVQLKGEKEGAGYGDRGGSGRKQAQQQLREALRQDLEKEAAKKTADLQQQVTDRLEARLGDVQQELDQVVNRVTAEALKRKAAQIGQIKNITEDPQNGSLTIVLEV